MREYEPIDPSTPGLTLVRVLLTVCIAEFFGPWGRDFSTSHVFNPDWVGHARVHMMWLLGFFLFSGLANLWLVWGVQPQRLVHLQLCALWLAANLLGFWIAIATAGIYDGLIVVPGVHVFVFGVEENVFAFAVLTAILLAAVAVLRFVVRPRVGATRP